MGSIPGVSPFFSCVKQAQLMISQHGGESPGDNVTKSTRFSELGNVFLVGWKVVPPGLDSHVTVGQVVAPSLVDNNQQAPF